MSRAVPKNVAAAVGLVPTVLGGMRRLPVKAVQLPVMAVGSALAGIDAAKREYDDLAARGERLITRLLGSGLAEEVAEVTAAPTLPQKVRTAAKLTAAQGLDLTTGARANAAESVREGVALAKDRGEATTALASAQDRQDSSPGAPPPPPAAPAPAAAASSPAAVAAPAPTGGPGAAAGPVQESLPVNEPVEVSRHDTAAPPAVVDQVDRIAANLNPPTISEHSELPLPDYDHMTLGALRGRLRSLDMTQLVQLRDYEKSKADRLPVVTMLDNRISRLANGETTTQGNPPAADRSSGSRPPKTVVAPAAAGATSAPGHQKVRTT